MNEYKTIKDILKVFELDTKLTLLLRSGQRVAGGISEWDWEGETVCLLTNTEIIEIRIAAIDAVIRSR